MGTKATLLMVLHNHQPVGNFDHVFEECTERCYHPVLETLADFPAVRLTLHTTGPLLEWLDTHRPDTIALMRTLAERGQIEILGGCHEEAMAAVLRDKDVIGQVQTMRDWCTDHLGQTPRGMWLAERVWEPDLPRVLHAAGVEYTLLDDIGFRFAGIDEPTVWGHFVTEKSGSPLNVFPIDQQLRYLIPFEEPEDVVAHLLKCAEDAGQHVWLTYGDDGEKFGVWPRTWDRVFGEKDWLRRFFQTLTDHADEVGTATLSDAVDQFDSRGRVYLPTCSYDEMMEWAQPTKAVTDFHEFRHALVDEERWDEARPFVRGGIWPTFLSKYEEADRMHKRGILLSHRVERLAEAVDPADEPKLEKARRALYRGQCNDAFWHGLFGGLYLSNLRHGIWASLLEAEALLDTLDPPDGRLRPVDTDLDGKNEYVGSDGTLAVAIHPHRGGSVSEVSFLPARFCLTNTLSRREEHYHQAMLEPPEPKAPAGTEKAGEDGEEEVVSIHDLHVVKEEGLEKLLVYDAAPLYCLRDRFLDRGASFDAWAEGTQTDPIDTGDFAHGDYAVVLEGEALVMTRVGHVGARRVRVQKRLWLDDGGLCAEWMLSTADEGGALDVVFAPECAFTLHAPKGDDRGFLFDGVAPEDPNMVSRGVAVAKSCALVDGYSGFRLDATATWAAEWWRAPVESVSASEAGIERIYQASVLLPRWTGTLGTTPTTLRLTLRGHSL